MPKPGIINNPKGRPKGKPNKITADLRQRIKNFLDNNFNEVQADFKKLDPVQKLAFYEKLLKFAVPVLNSNDVKIDIENLNEKDLDTLIERLINKPNKQ